MSTLKVSEIRNASSATGGLSIAADGVVSGALPYPNRNLLYNGAMQVAQRGTSTASITTTGYYTADRWQTPLSGLGTWTQTIENDAPTSSGFVKSIKLVCTSADLTPSASDQLSVAQRLEGQDLQRIKKGASAAQQLTLSFWVKSNVTGTYIVNLIDTDNTRQVSASYSISASATWEKKTITFPADTTGVFDNDNNQSLLVFFRLGAGSDLTSGTLRTTWTTNTTADLAVGQTNLAAATNNYWQITGVQLEVGDTATEFEHLPFGVELARCQRYYFRSNPGTAYGLHGLGVAGSSTTIYCAIETPVVMRTAVTAIEYSALEIVDFGVSTHAVTNLTLDTASNKCVQLAATVASSAIAQGDAAGIRNSNNATGYVAVTAEL